MDGRQAKGGCWWSEFIHTRVKEVAGDVRRRVAHVLERVPGGADGGQLPDDEGAVNHLARAAPHGVGLGRGHDNGAVVGLGEGLGGILHNRLRV